MQPEPTESFPIYIAWIAPTEARVRIPVARVDRVGGERWSLSYTAGVARAQQLGFGAFPGMDDLDATYTSTEMFPFMRQRIMRRGRPEYERWLGTLALDAAAAAHDPVAVLLRSPGREDYDRLEFFAPQPLGGNTWRFVFYVRYLRGNPVIDARLAAGEPPAEPLAVQPVHFDGSAGWKGTGLAVTDAAGETLGYVATSFVQALQQCASRRVTILRVNPAPMVSSYRLLLQVDATMPDGWQIEADTPELRPWNSLNDNIRTPTQGQLSAKWN
jgi:hypothetical protein